MQKKNPQRLYARLTIIVFETLRKLFSKKCCKKIKSELYSDVKTKKILKRFLGCSEISGMQIPDDYQNLAILKSIKDF